MIHRRLTSSSLPESGDFSIFYCFFMLQLLHRAIITLLLSGSALARSSNNNSHDAEKLPFKILELTNESLKNDTLLPQSVNIYYIKLNISDALDLFRIFFEIEAPKKLSSFGNDSFFEAAVSNGRDSVTLSLPLLLRSGLRVFQDGRILKPLLPEDFRITKKSKSVDQFLVISIMSRINQEIPFRMHLKRYDRSQYFVKLSTKISSRTLASQTVNHVKPLAFRINVTDLPSFMVRVSSPDKICASLVSIGPETNLYSTSLVQKVTTNRILSFTQRADLYFSKEEVSNHPAVDVFVFVNADDSDCGNFSDSRELAKNKQITISFFAPNSENFWLATVATPISFFLPFLSCFMWIFMKKFREERGRKRVAVDDENLIHLNDSPNSTLDSGETPVLTFSHDVSPTPRRDETSEVHQSDQHDRPQELPPVESSLFPILTGIFRERQVNYYPIALLFPIFLHTATEYYKWHNSPLANRDEMCFHNFACARPLGEFASFNHIYSNVGYALCGCQFILVVLLRKDRYSKSSGVYSSTGLDVTIGVYLVMQAVASAVYHICPNSIAYQFDTPFIEILCSLIVLRQWYVRKQIHSAAHANFIVVLFLVLHFVVSLGDHWFWTRYLLACFQMTLVGTAVRRKLLENKGIAAVSQIGSAAWALSTVVLNALLVINYAIFVNAIHLNQISTFCCLLNAVIYIAYYIWMKKVVFKENISRFSYSMGALGIFFWALAVSFFVHDETDWTLSPARSRALNQECIFLNFYDSHDMWHITSAFAIFFSLLLITTLDDDQNHVDKHILNNF
ncbi:unnamed protein product [Caenorhabditis auriculariae]|uniref:SID1 transmembrane family member 1 n=1 Tax=Caenorhabditis auriculariae TaxID=2777116 RepID=A0A8S1HDL6_9PELO|nr:unnamed protein product [Caenorhabditis auriculariae]